jgi:signal transduction histidine kinase
MNIIAGPRRSPGAITAGESGITNALRLSNQNITVSGLASMVHDLRNPLAAIYGCAEMLLEADFDPAQTQRVASNIYRAAGRMRELLADAVTILRGHAQPIENTNLRETLIAACNSAGVSGRDDIEVHLDVPARLEISIQRARMEGVFLNLLINALEAMPCGGSIRIGAREMADHVRIEVEDTGCGIPAAIRNRLFEPFVTAGKTGGLGLGLAISRATVREHGGDLWAEPASGARFIVSLPLQSGQHAHPSVSDELQNSNK